jgi:hypothetical protein
MTEAADLITISHYENEIQFHLHDGRLATARSVTLITGSCALLSRKLAFALVPPLTNRQLAASEVRIHGVASRLTGSNKGG